MKQFTVVSFLLFTFFTAFGQISYVNSLATGSNDGSSWNDAYINLDSALSNTSTGQIWVAKGIYTPLVDSSTQSSSFLIDKEISIFGGFEGNEQAIIERNLEINKTILNGDIANNDEPNNFSIYKDDNLTHILVVDSFLSSPIRIDGFVFKGGHTNSMVGSVDFEKKGGSIYAYSTIELENCSFENNYAYGGACVYISSITNGGNNSTFKKCTFQNNFSDGESAGILIENLTNIQIDSCLFEDNTTTHGVIEISESSSVEISACTFQRNIGYTDDDFGGVLFLDKANLVTVNKCDFMQNVAGNGGVMSIDGVGETSNYQNITINECNFLDNQARSNGGVIFSNLAGWEIKDSYFEGNFSGRGGCFIMNGVGEEIDPNNIKISNCTFLGNYSTGFGGGVMYCWATSYSMFDCNFDSNYGNNGGALFNSGDNKIISIERSTFENSEAEYGGSNAYYGINSEFYLKGNKYLNNKAEVSGGAAIIGFEANVVMDSCVFEINESTFGGGIAVQNHNTSLSLKNSDFFKNSGTSVGGAIASDSGNEITVDNCQFEENYAQVGGAIDMFEINSPVPAFLNISNSFFSNNEGEFNGGAMRLSDVDARISNSVFLGNTSSSGGTIAFQAGNSNNAEVFILNSTLTSNHVSNTISLGTGSISSELVLTLQNCILEGRNNPSTIYGVAFGNPIVVSNGGNICTDLSLDSISTADDLNNVSDPYFVDNDLDLNLMANSPAINFGIDSGAPLTDIIGNPRVGKVDAGAYEFQGVSPNENILSNTGSLIIKPNPVRESLNFVIHNSWNGKLQMRLFSIDGKLIKEATVNKKNDEYAANINVRELAPSIYYLVLSDGKEGIVESFVKE